MKTKYKILLVVAPLVFILDQITKSIILKYVDFGAKIPVIPGFFDIVHFRNTGAAFGMFANLSESIRVPFFYVIAAIAALFLALYYRSLPDNRRMLPFVLSLIFAGIAGNIIDRIRFGSVVDFLSLHIGNRVLTITQFGKPIEVQLEWPAFNVADTAITVAMVLLFWMMLFRKEL